MGARDSFASGPRGWWLSERHPLYPPFLSTAWNLLALADLGATRETPGIAAPCEYWLTKIPEGRDQEPLSGFDPRARSSRDPDRDVLQFRASLPPRRSRSRGRSGHRSVKAPRAGAGAR